MSGIDIGSIVVAFIAAIAAWASQRAASKASGTNTQVAGRLDAEKEAYERARAFDTETIRRQDAEIAELRAEARALHAELRNCHIRLQTLEDKTPLSILGLEGLLRERNEEAEGPEASDQK